jgi:hypothetical protein
MLARHGGMLKGGAAPMPPPRRRAYPLVRRGSGT